jgi:hypothetical protein
VRVDAYCVLICNLQFPAKTCQLYTYFLARVFAGGAHQRRVILRCRQRLVLPTLNTCSHVELGRAVCLSLTRSHLAVPPLSPCSLSSTARFPNSACTQAAQIATMLGMSKRAALAGRSWDRGRKVAFYILQGPRGRCP